MKKITMRTAVLVLAAVVLVIAAAGCQRSPTSRLTMQITSPSTRATVTEPAVTVTGVVSEPGASVTVMDNNVQVASDGAFSYEVPLTYGSNRIAVRASMDDQSSTRTLTITRNLVLDVYEPADKGTAAEDLVNVSGMVSDIAARVLVNGTEVAVNEDGTFSVPVPLYYQTTTLNVSTVLDGVDPITRLITVSKASAE